MLFGSRLNKLATSIRRALSEYAVLGINPPFVADFIEKKYLTGGASSTFSSAITHARAGNATMTDGYGPELVTNGGFDSDLSGWADTNSHWSVVDGRAYHASSSAYNPLSLTLSLSGTYILTFDAEVISASNTAHLLVDGTSTQLLANGSDSYSVFITDATTIVFSREPGSTAEFYIDNVSVREMPVIKWAPHNLLSYSEDFAQSSWIKSNVSVTPNMIVAPDGSMTADTLASTNGYFYQQFTAVSNTNYTAKIYLYAPSAINGLHIRFTDTSFVVLGLGAYVNVTAGWNVFTVTDNVGSNTAVRFVVGGSGTFPNGTELYAWGAHVYRSDLGGMAGNPDQPPSRASYVPTTSSAVYLPRVGHHVYNGSAWVNEGLLAESESRTNLIQYSDASSGWSASAGTLTANSGVSPDGSENASSFVEDNNSANHQIVEASISGLLANVDNTFSAYVKTLSGSRYAQLRIYGVGTDKGWASFDLSSGVLSGSGGTSLKQSTIQNIGNGWFRVSITTNHTTTYGVSIALADSGATEAPAYTGDSTSGIYFYGIQVEQGSTPSSLIPTSGSSVTRPAETFTIPSANLPWPEPNYIGSELVTNGTFDTDTSGWATQNQATAAVVNGEVQVTGDGGYDDRINQTISTEVGKIYKVTATLRKISASARIGIRRASSPFSDITASTVSSTSNTDVELLFVADQTSFNIQLYSYTAGAGTAAFDNISVREIDPLSVSIAMDGRMTYADEDASGQQRLYSWRDDASNRLNLDLYTNSTNEGTFIIDQVASGTYDNASSGEVYSPDVLVPFNVSSRHGSTFVNLATDGTSHTANTTPTALSDLSATDLDLAGDYMGTLATFRVWDRDIGDTGIVEATNPSLEPSLSLTFEGTGTNSFVINDWSE